MTGWSIRQSRQFLSAEPVEHKELRQTLSDASPVVQHEHCTRHTASAIGVPSKWFILALSPSSSFYFTEESGEARGKFHGPAEQEYVSVSTCTSSRVLASKRGVVTRTGLEMVQARAIANANANANASVTVTVAVTAPAH